MLVGNKCDLENEREVNKLEGQAVAKDWDCPFYETSALIGTNVQEAFYSLVREIRKAQTLQTNQENNKKNSCLLI
uniref:Small monomeric GTPase n=1 Tax=Arcella intermedia TaxID=1963864 RepID=A0A6B2LV01_9EUKA